MKTYSFFVPALFAGVATFICAGVAAAETIYVSNSLNDTIAEINPITGTTTTIGNSSELDSPTGLAINSLGDLFIANNGSGTGTGDIEEYNPLTETFTTFATGLSNPRGLAFDSEGNLFVANQSTGVITEFLANTSTPITYATGLNTPNGIAIDTMGDLYVALGSTANAIARIDTSGNVSNFDTTGMGLNAPNGIVFGPDGNLYVVNHYDPSVEEIGFNLHGTPYISNNPANGLNGPKTLAFDAEGNLYVTDAGNNTVTEYNSAGQLINTFSNDIDGPCFVLAGPTFFVAVPEPSTCVLLLGAGVALYFYRRRRTAAPVRV